MNRLALLPSMLALLAGCAAAPANLARTAPAPAAVPDALSEMIRTLASDEFEGRAPGTPGEAKTIDWLIAHFREAGAEPGGPDGNWVQDVPLLHTSLDTSVPLTVAGRGDTRKLVQGTDIYVSTQRDADRAAFADAPLVFVGYGVTAPEKQWDDFKGIDLKGKVAVFLVNDPDFAAAPGEDPAGRFGGKAMTYYGRWSYKFEEAVRRGAVGALIVHETDAAGYGWNTVVSPGGENYDLARQEEGRLVLQGWLHGGAARDLLARAGLDLEDLKRKARRADFQPVALAGQALSAAIPVTREYITSRNVIARITGAQRPEEVVTFGAHWDAYGVGSQPDSQGRTIRAGALDDASGVAALIELARMFREGGQPKRTVLLGAWTAEERGLLGSEAFMASGLYPAEKIVANITMDTLQPNGPARDFILIGEGQSSLEDDLAVVAAAQGRTVTPDSKPERGLFYRADHFSFVKRGVPALTMLALGGGVDLVNGGRAAGEKWVNEFTADCYHQTCDVWRPEWDLRGVAQDVDLAYAIGRKLADSTDWPEWKPSSEFAELRKR